MAADKALRDNPEMPIYPIGEVTRETGVNSVTLRAWERRYGLLRPRRTPKGHRLYTRRDIQRVRRIVRLIDQGIPVGRVRPLLDGTVSGQAALEAAPFGTEFASLNREVMAACARLRVAGLDAAINRGLAALPLDVFYRRVVEPARMELRARAERGEMPAAGPAFFDAVAGQRLAARLAHRDTKQARARHGVWLCGLPREDERIALLVHALACAEAGLQPVALTAPLSPDAVADGVRRAGAGAMVLVARSPVVDAAVQQALMRLGCESGVPCLVGGPAALMSGDAFSAIGFEVLPPSLTEAAERIRERAGIPPADGGRRAAHAG